MASKSPAISLQIPASLSLTAAQRAELADLVKTNVTRMTATVAGAGLTLPETNVFLRQARTSAASGAAKKAAQKASRKGSSKK